MDQIKACNALWSRCMNGLEQGSFVHARNFSCTKNRGTMKIGLLQAQTQQQSKVWFLHRTKDLPCAELTTECVADTEGMQMKTLHIYDSSKERRRLAVKTMDTCLDAYLSTS